MSLSNNKEDYIKALFHLTSDLETNKAGINQLAKNLNLSPASVNNMLKKLKLAGLVDHEKYGKVQLTKEGKKLAVQLIRKHRIWETFLHEKLGFSWDEVHDVAEQLEHIKSKKLIDQLDAYLGHPTHDPHGDPIPAENGSFKRPPKKRLSEAETGKAYRLAAVDDSSSAFLQYVSQIGLSLGQKFNLLSREAFDDSLLLKINRAEVRVSSKFAENVYVV